MSPLSIWSNRVEGRVRYADVAVQENVVLRRNEHASLKGEAGFIRLISVTAASSLLKSSRFFWPASYSAALATFDTSRIAEDSFAIRHTSQPIPL